MNNSIQNNTNEAGTKKASNVDYINNEYNYFNIKITV